MKTIRLFAFLAISLLVINCEPTPDEETPVDPSVSSADKIKAAIDNLENNVPSWDRIFDLADPYDRLPAPDFATRWVQFWQGTPNTIEGNMNVWDGYMSSGVATVSPFNTYAIGLEYGVLPDSTDYPIMNLNVLDKKLRMIATLLLEDIAAGNHTLFQHFYPDGATDLGFTNETDFRSYIENNFRVEKAKEAVMAENLNLDYLVPFPEPIESWINIQGFAKDYSVEQKVALAQHVLNVVSDETRKIFEGILVVPSGAEYSQPDSPWAKLDFSAFDEIHFTLLPNCEVTKVETDLEIQLINIKEVIGKHPQLRWGIAQLAVYEPILSNCSDGAFSNYQNELLQTIFKQLDELEQSNANHAFSGVFADFLVGSNEALVSDYWSGK